MTARGLHVVPANGTATVSTDKTSPDSGLPALLRRRSANTESDWTSRAVCANQDPDLLFVTGAAQRDAAKMCHGCPVKLECLADALDNGVEFGVWGGLTERQRRAILRKSPHVTSWLDVLTESRQDSTAATAG